MSVSCQLADAFSEQAAKDLQALKLEIAEKKISEKTILKI